MKDTYIVNDDNIFYSDEEDNPRIHSEKPPYKMRKVTLKDELTDTVPADSCGKGDGNSF